MSVSEGNARVKSIEEKARRALMYGLGGVLLAHGILQLNNTVTKYANLACPSKERAAFRKTFHFPIEGWEEDIEKNHFTIPVVSAVLHKEKMECPVTLSSLYIRPEGYF